MGSLPLQSRAVWADTRDAARAAPPIPVRKERLSRAGIECVSISYAAPTGTQANGRFTMKKIGLVGVAAFLLPLLAAAQAGPSIQAIGSATVTGQPDQVKVDIGVT